MRVLLSAFACMPGSGSEPSVGWETAFQAAARHEVWVLTNEANREKIEGWPEGPLPSTLHFEYVALPRPLRLIQAGPVRHHLYYCLWQLRAFFRARALHARIGFDLVHHVTYVNSWMPSLMGWLGVPFIWNAGGRERTPWSFYRSMSLRGKLAEVARDCAMAVMTPLARLLAGSRARAILTCSAPAEWPSRFPVTRFAQGGLSKADLESMAKASPRVEPPFRVISAGRLLGLKGFSLVIQAFAGLRRDLPGCEYWIVGEGPEQSRLVRLASDLGCGASVRFLGWRPRPEVLRLMAEADVLVHPSLHEQFCYVLLEAMASGRPVITLDRGGPSIVAAPPGAILLDARSPEQVIQDLSVALGALALDRADRTSRGRAAREHAVGQWSWSQVGERLMRVYSEAARQP